MYAEQAYRGSFASPLAAFQKFRELGADRAPLVWEAG
jgi:hypothetical protein